MFFLGERTASVNEGRRLAESLVASGQALETFQECIHLQGGDEHVIDNYSLLPGAKFKTDVTSHEAGYLAATRCMDMGIALAMLEGGRAKKEDRIDHGVSLEFHKRIGDKVEKGEPLVTIHYNSESKLPAAKKLLESSYILADSAPPIPPQIRQIIGGK